jgi:hypothetical protein
VAGALQGAVRVLAVVEVVARVEGKDKYKDRDRDRAGGGVRAASKSLDNSATPILVSDTDAVIDVDIGAVQTTA